jgi:PKD repeat protein
VIVEDNDGARYDSSTTGNEDSPLLIANDDANMNIPLITLNVNKTQLLVDESVNFTVSAKNILGTDITGKSEYYWDFDGDARIDEKTTEPQAKFSYKRSGKYNMKVKVVNNGVSNTKYQVIYVRNELKANAVGYKIGDMVYFMNTSKGKYDTVKWQIGTTESISLYGISIPVASIQGLDEFGNLTITSGTDTSSIKLQSSMIETVMSVPGDVEIQSFPKMESGSIQIDSPGMPFLLSFYGNSGVKEYIVDADTKIDSDLDAIGDNDKDNKDSSSYTD